MSLKVFDCRREEDLCNVLVTPQIRSRLFCLDPGSEALDFHAHDLGHEVFLIMQGRCRFEIDGKEAVLEPGQACIALADQPHRVTVVGDEPVLMYLSVSPHIVPTHTHLTPEGGRQPYQYRPPSQYNAKEDSSASLEELAGRFIALSKVASAKLREGGEQAADLKEAVSAGNKKSLSAIRNGLWGNLRQAFESIYRLGEVWNDLAPRVDMISDRR